MCLINKRLVPRFTATPLKGTLGLAKRHKVEQREVENSTFHFTD